MMNAMKKIFCNGNAGMATRLKYFLLMWIHKEPKLTVVYCKVFIDILVDYDGKLNSDSISRLLA